MTGHARHLVEVPFPNGMRLTIVREDDYDAVTIWSEDGESIFTHVEAPHFNAVIPPPPVGGWEEASRDEVLRLLRTINRECDIGRHEADVLSIIDRLAAPPPPSVSIDNGSRPQEAVPTEQAEAAVLVLKRMLGEVESFHRAPDNARIWIGGWSTYSGQRDPSLVHVGEVRAAIGDADGCSSNEGAAEEPDKCPICAEPFKPDDMCAIDITEGTCHAACLEGSAIVDLDTEEPSGGPIFTFRYGSDEGIPASPQTADGCSSNEGAALWAMHLRGPDDIYPAPDHATAQNWCDYVNDYVAQVGSDVEVVAAPVHWSGTAEAHAEGLPLAVAGWTLPDGHPAQAILPQTEKGS